MLHTIGVSQCDSSCFLFFWGRGIYFSKSELPSRGSRKEEELIHLHSPSPFRMAKISLYPHHNYWWAPVWDCYPCLLLTFFASIRQCFENMQLTTKCFLNLTWVSLRCANVKEQVLLEVAFLVLAYAPYFQRRWAQRESNQQPGRWGHVSPGKWCR